MKMRKATATYVAPIGDNKVVEMGGVTFFDGKATEINSHEHPHLIQKLQQNAHFDVVVSEDDKKGPTLPAKRGRPSNATLAEMKAKAEAADKAAKDAAEAAKVAKADRDEAVKAASGSNPQPVSIGIQQPDVLNPTQ
jgi:ABC-type sugar transport system ATPase subunit